MCDSKLSGLVLCRPVLTFFPTALKGMEIWKIEEGSGPLMIDEDLFLTADVELHDCLVVAAHVTVFGALSGFFSVLVPSRS